MITAVEKELSGNDTGETGGHQAGMLIPKGGDVLKFFPELPSGIKNPRVVLDFVDETGRIWAFNFIYYNGKFFGGTRNEYRLTGMTQYIRAFNLKTGDTIVLEKESERLRRICYRRRGREEGAPLKLGLGGWRIIDFSDED